MFKARSLLASYVLSLTVNILSYLIFAWALLAGADIRFVPFGQPEGWQKVTAVCWPLPQYSQNLKQRGP